MKHFRVYCRTFWIKIMFIIIAMLCITQNIHFAFSRIWKNSWRKLGNSVWLHSCLRFFQTSCNFSQMLMRKFGCHSGSDLSVCLMNKLLFSIVFFTITQQFLTFWLVEHHGKWQTRQWCWHHKPIRLQESHRQCLLFHQSRFATQHSKNFLWICQ